MKNSGLSQEIHNRILSVLRADNRIKQVVLFGSRAIGTFREGSDIDLAVQTDPIPFSEWLNLRSKLDQLMLPWTIDLLNEADITNPDLLEHIRTYGVKWFP
jgi:predicted nucleotidyltransferase